MGAGQSVKSYGPTYSSVVNEIKVKQVARGDQSRSEDEQAPLLAESEDMIEPFPYKRTRLRDVNYQKIIEVGEPWNDPTFPHGPQALFIDGV
mmetsp:Transcript_10532/g.17670  ORF Transcript_10532/g.17670 Transcript_10532/m.17670 type:complete len:92 (-) Transcript_10532:76-351(-)